MFIKKNKLIAYTQLMRVEKPIGTVLLACPMLWALWIAANGQPNPYYVLIFLLGAFVMRSAGCVINDFADRKIDSKVKRTKNRPLTSGLVSSKEALGLFSVLILLALLLLLLLPKNVFMPALLALALVILYPFTKRFFHIPQLVLGAAFSTSILMAFMAETGEISFVSWVLYIASTTWTVIYDTFYAMVDRDDDKDLKLHSSALFFANSDLLVIRYLIILFISLMVLLGVLLNLNFYYYISLFFSSLCFIYQLVICRNKQREACFIAFLNNQWVGVFIFIGILLN